MASGLAGRRSEYLFAEHLGEVEVELRAATEEGIFEAAAAAFTELAGGADAGTAEERRVDVSAPDRALLLVEWLGELVFLAEVEGFVPGGIRTLQLDDASLSAVVSGRRGHPRHLVKAVTLSRLAYACDGGTWHARVVLDV